MDSNKRSHSPESSVCHKKVRLSETTSNPNLNVQPAHQDPDIVNIPGETVCTSSIQQQSSQSSAATCSFKLCSSSDNSSLHTFHGLKNYNLEDIYDQYTSLQPDNCRGPHLCTDGEEGRDDSRSECYMPGSKIYDGTQASRPRRSLQDGKLALGVKLNIFTNASCLVKLNGRAPVASRVPEMLCLLYTLREIALRVQDELDIERYLNIAENLELLIAHIREISTARTPPAFGENSCFSNDCLLFWYFCQTTYRKNKNAYGLLSFYQSLYQYLEEYTKTLKPGTYSQAKEGAKHLYDELSILIDEPSLSTSQ